MSTPQLPFKKFQRRKTGWIALPNHHHLLLGGSLGTLAQTTRVQYCQNLSTSYCMSMGLQRKIPQSITSKITI
jgi:hypothetical protein